MSNDNEFNKESFMDFIAKSQEHMVETLNSDAVKKPQALIIISSLHNEDEDFSRNQVSIHGAFSIDIFINTFEAIHNHLSTVIVSEMKGSFPKLPDVILHEFVKATLIKALMPRDTDETDNMVQ